MEETYYYVSGRRIAVDRVRSARVVPIPEDRDVVSVPGFHSIPTGNRRFSLLVNAEVVPDEAVRVRRLEELADRLAASDRAGDEALARGERSIDSELGTPGIPVLRQRDGGLLLPTGEVAARFVDGLDRAAIEREVARRGGRVIRPLGFLPNGYLVAAPSGQDGLALANALIEAGLAELASPNFIEEIPPRAVPPPPVDLFASQWHLDNVGQTRGKPGADVRALEAWEITTGSPEIVIAILDSGVDSRHEAFSTPGKLVAGYDFEDDDPLGDPTDSSHGTSCAGVAAGAWGPGRTVGIAPGCRIMSIRRSSLSEHLKLAEALAFAADRGADIVSCSFGVDGRAWLQPDVVKAAVTHAVSRGRGGRGCVIVWAAGNGNEAIESDEWASNPDVIAVGASTDEDLRAGYSDYGGAVALCAPSSGGRARITTTSNGGYTDRFGGTSSSAPLVAGVAALLLSVDPGLTAPEVRDLLCRTADKIDPGGGAYDPQGRSPWYGHGRVNAHRALLELSTLTALVRDTDLAPRAGSIRRFATETLGTRPAGRAIVAFVTARRFRVLELARTSPSFRADVLAVLAAVADAQEAIDRGAEPMIPGAAIDAVVAALTQLFAIAPAPMVAVGA